MSSAKRGSRQTTEYTSYYNGHGNYMVENNENNRESKYSDVYYEIKHNDWNPRRIKSRSQRHANKSLENSYNNDSYRLVKRSSSAQLRKNQYYADKQYTKGYSMDSLNQKGGPEIEVESDYEYIPDSRVQESRKLYAGQSSSRNQAVETDVCCSCYGTSQTSKKIQTESNTQLHPASLRSYQDIHVRRNNEKGRYSEDDVYDSDIDRKKLFDEYTRVQNERYERERYERLERERKTAYNTSKRHVGVQMNTRYVIHDETSSVKKPQLRNASSQTTAPMHQPWEIITPIRPPTPPGSGVQPHIRRMPSPEVIYKTVNVPHVQKSPLPEVSPRSPTPEVSPRSPKSKGPKVVPFIGEPPDPNDVYLTAYIGYKDNKKHKKKVKPEPKNGIIVQIIEQEPPVPVPVKEPPKEPEIIYYVDPTPTPQPTPPPSPPSTPPPFWPPKKVHIVDDTDTKYGIHKYGEKMVDDESKTIPRRKTKANMTRVGGGWMKVEHHRNHHIPLTVYEHPRAQDDKFLYIKSRYTPDKARVPIAYKKYREMYVARNGKLG